MKITKYEHSCLDLEMDGKRFLIDPGTLTTSVPNYENIAAVLVTHVHPDHLDTEKLQTIHAQNPDAVFYTVQAVADELKDTLPYSVVTGGQRVNIGPFQLEFTGGKHAEIHKTIPLTDNVGVQVNGSFYYSGDSLSLPTGPVVALAVPIAAPWLKMSEAMDFITAIKPKHVFPVHDLLLSDFGISVHERMLKMASESVGAEYVNLLAGQSLTI